MVIFISIGILAFLFAVPTIVENRNISYYSKIMNHILLYIIFKGIFLSLQSDEIHSESLSQSHMFDR